MNDGALSSTATVRGPFVPENTAPEAPAAGFWALTIGSIGVVYGDIARARSMHCANR
jgi:hypothetical protein